MNGWKVMAAVLLAVGVSQSAFASQQLARARNCMSCHGVSNKIVGPAFKDIAQRYAGQKGAEELLAERIVKGSSGHWGVIPMRANTHVSEAEAKSLASWILQQK